MGHTVGVHKGSYRLPDDIYQTAKVSKLLMLMEKGASSQFKGKNIEDIPIEELDLNENLLDLSENEDDDVVNLPIQPIIDEPIIDESDFPCSTPLSYSSPKSDKISKKKGN